ncbi:hypothetical protein AHAS_Ahas18G0109200 [Arachis hypogaea]
MELLTFGVRILKIRNSNKKSNLMKVFVSPSFTCWCHFCSMEVAGGIPPLPLEFGQLEF